MRTWIISALLASFAIPALAEEKVDWKFSFPETKERFIKVQQTWAKKDPYWNPTREALAAKFDELDTNGDGLLSEEEWNARQPNKKKADKTAAKKEAPKKDAPFDFPVSKETFVKKNREWASNPQKGWNFNQAKTEARFDEWDTDGDGMLSREEWDNRQK